MPKRSIQMFQNLQESIPVTALCTNHAVAPQQRGDPSGYVQALVMLAGRQNLQATPFLAPAMTKSGMEGETGLILKNDRLSRFQLLKFFLTSPGTSSHLHFWPEYRSNLRASSDIPDDASIAEPDALSGLCQSAFLNEQRPLAHPIEPDSNQNHAASYPDALRVPAEPYLPNWSGGLGAVLASKIQARAHLRRASIGLNSFGSGRAHLLSSLVAALQSLKVALQSLSRSMRQGSSRQRLTAFPLLRQYALRLRLDFS
jgi:hypothetical protein